ncbi:MAG: hypothetical protein ACOC92_00780 [bacterium]
MPFHTPSPFESSNPSALPPRRLEGHWERPRTRRRPGAPAGSATWTLAWLAAGLLALVGSGAAPAEAQRPGGRKGQELVPRSHAAVEKAGDATRWLYAVDDGRNDGSSTVYRLGKRAPNGFVAVERVAETGVEDVFDIAFAGDRLFGIGPATSYGRSDDVLIEIDPDTGATDFRTFLDASRSFNALVGESGSTLLAATTDGVLWRIRVGSWKATRIGSFGFGVDSAGDLALTSEGALYATTNRLFSTNDDLARIDRKNGASSLVGSLGAREAYGLAIEPGTRALMGVVDAERSPKLVYIDGQNGATTLIGGIGVPAALTGLAVRPTGAASCPGGFFSDSEYPDFCFRVKIGPPGDARAGRREADCLDDTVCVSGAVPGRPELFVRILGPRPNGFLWPTIIRFTPARVVVDVRQLSTRENNRYVLSAVPPGKENLSGRQDRKGFRP